MRWEWLEIYASQRMDTRRRWMAVHRNGSVYELDQYEKVLKKQFPEQVRDLYAAFVCGEADRVASRKHYQWLAKYLKKYRLIPKAEKLLPV